MNKSLITLAILAAAGLSACGGGGDNDPVAPAARISYDPAGGVLPIPNDLLKSGTTDGTLNIPGADETNPFDPQGVLSSLDGWSVSTPFTIDLDVPANTSLPQGSIQQANGVVLLEVTAGGGSDCPDLSPIAACQLSDTLTYGSDYVASFSGDSIAVVPLKPLKAKTSYVIATTTALQDTQGNPVLGDSTYNLLKQNAAGGEPGSSEATLQQAVNSYEGLLEQSGVAKNTVTYSGLFTTESTIDVLAGAKLALLGALGNQVLSLSTPVDTGLTAAQLLIAQGAIEAGSPAAQLASAAKVYQAQLTLPYFLDFPTPAKIGNGECDPQNLATACPAISSRWIAAGDSPAAVLLALQEGRLSQSNYGQQAANQGIDPSAALADPSLLIGASFTDDQGDSVDPNRFMTQFNPVPAVQSVQTVDVLITVPDATIANAIRAQMGLDPLTEGPVGWPVTVYGHGITSYKETGLAIAGTLAAQGQAMVAIDLPMHGSRGIDVDGNDVIDISATSGGPNAPVVASDVSLYANLASLATVRDNLRESVIDQLALRVALASATVPGGELDGSSARYLGVSLGSIVGVQAVAVGNTPTLNPEDGSDVSGLFQFNAAGLSVPGAGLAGVFAFSPAFADTVRAGLVESATFQAALADANTNNLQPGDAGYDDLVAAVYEAFLPQFVFAAQTIVDAADPIAYGATLTANTPAVLVHEVVGDGSPDNPGDQVIPNSNAEFGAPLSGTEPLIAAMGLDPIVATVANAQGVSGVARFNAGAHSSLLDPSVDATVTTEMQTQMGSFLGSDGTLIQVQTPDVLIGAN
ncbi:VolA/Pla-1 family phospholipase [Alloalcanivorax mobilis]|uniref:VolA/Pla-1 family phospholipase n=1 Tax=Alloalcanivorax mobilis TaxID=2019569 RepID=UPI000C78A5D2|nr:VolA/Pla-1 family phospholipase [Alloalcanivorax mobilis]